MTWEHFQRCETVTIVGGGWSVCNVAIDKLAGRVIAVNDSALYVPHWHVAVSMDRLWTEHRLEAAILRAMENSPHSAILLRRSAVQNFPADLAQRWPVVKVFECDHERSDFSHFDNQLNGTNSGACALNLAWKMRPRRLFLLGFDMNRSPDGRAYWYPPYEWSTAAGGTSSGKYKTWAKQFADAAAAFKKIRCEVFNVSPGSAIAAFQKITPAQYLKAGPWV